MFFICNSEVDDVNQHHFAKHCHQELDPTVHIKCCFLSHLLFNVQQALDLNNEVEQMMWMAESNDSWLVSGQMLHFHDGTDFSDLTINKLYI